MGFCRCPFYAIFRSHEVNELQADLQLVLALLLHVVCRPTQIKLFGHDSSWHRDSATISLLSSPPAPLLNSLVPTISSNRHK